MVDSGAICNSIAAISSAAAIIDARPGHITGEDAIVEGSRKNGAA